MVWDISDWWLDVFVEGFFQDINGDCWGWMDCRETPGTKKAVSGVNIGSKSLFLGSDAHIPFGSDITNSHQRMIEARFLAKILKALGIFKKPPPR